MIKAVIFDLDGTLLDRDASVVKFINNQYDRLHRFVGHISKEKYAARFIELDNHGYVWKDKVYQQLVGEFEIGGITWEEMLQDYIYEFKNNCVPFPNLVEMLEELTRRNVRIGMITNGKGQFQMDNINALGIEKYFDAILVSECEGIRKPDIQLFNRAIERLNVPPSESLFVGDHPVNDVEAAKNAGMIGVWKKDIHWDAPEADFSIDDLAEVPLIIDRISAESV